MREFTELEKAHINFFGNAAEFSAQVRELESYLHEIHNYIQITYSHLLSDKIKGYDERTLENLKYHFQYTHGDILRKSGIIATVIMLETGIDIYCRDFQKHKKLKVGYKDFKGDLLERLKLYSSKILNSTFDFNSLLWQDIVGLYEVRNCLVHNNGSVENFGKRKVIESFIKRNPAFGISDNEFIEISHAACILGLRFVEQLYDKLTWFAFEIFPDTYSDDLRDLK